MEEIINTAEENNKENQSRKKLKGRRRLLIKVILWDKISLKLKYKINKLIKKRKTEVKARIK